MDVHSGVAIPFVIEPTEREPGCESPANHAVVDESTMDSDGIGYTAVQRRQVN